MNVEEREKIIDVFPKFFEVGFYNERYYDIVLTNKRMVLVWMGESYKPWMLRIDPGMYKREELKKINSVDWLIKYHKKNIFLNYHSIDQIILKGRTVISNGYISIRTKDNLYKLYNKEKKIDYFRIYSILENYLEDKMIFKSYKYC